MSWQHALQLSGITYLAVAFGLCLLFDRDYGRGVCWQRTLGGVGQMMFAIPVLVVVFLAYAPFALIGDICDRRRKDPGSVK